MRTPHGAEEAIKREHDDLSGGEASMRLPCPGCIRASLDPGPVREQHVTSGGQFTSAIQPSETTTDDDYVLQADPLLQ
jgi:hypothetical protein